jgi:hypothetical protein
LKFAFLVSEVYIPGIASLECFILKGYLFVKWIFKDAGKDYDFLLFRMFLAMKDLIEVLSIRYFFGVSFGSKVV